MTRQAEEIANNKCHALFGLIKHILKKTGQEFKMFGKVLAAGKEKTRNESQQRHGPRKKEKRLKS